MNSSPDGVGGTGEKRHLQNSVVVARPPRGGSSPGPSRTPRPRGSARTPRSWPAGSPSWAARRGPEGLAVTLPELDRFVILQRGRGNDVLRRVARRRDHDICKQTRRRPRHGDLPVPASRWPRGRPRPRPADRPLPQPFPATRFQEVPTATSTVSRVCPAEPSGQQAGQADRTVRPAWLEAYMTQWPGRLSVCKGAAAALAAGRTRCCTAQVCTPRGCHGWSRCPFTGTQSRHPHFPPPRLGPRCSKEAAVTTSQIHSPGGDITSRELFSGTGQLNDFT